MSTPKPKTEKRSVKHVFTLEETAALHVLFTNAYDNLNAVTAESKSVKDSYKAKETEAASRMASLNATIRAGCEMREKVCVIITDFKAGKKFYYLETDIDEKGRPKKGCEPVITEHVTDEDRQQDLMEAEAKFEKREEIELFPVAGEDSGTLIIGRFGGKWYTALHVKIGTRIINERLDAEQPCSKKRFDQVNRALKRFGEWLETNLGREESKGFQNQIELVKAQHAEREE